MNGSVLKYLTDPNFQKVWNLIGSLLTGLRFKIRNNTKGGGYVKF